jgi:hypothetical protein
MDLTSVEHWAYSGLLDSSANNAELCSGKNQLLSSLWPKISVPSHRNDLFQINDNRCTSYLIITYKTVKLGMFIKNN